MSGAIEETREKWLCPHGCGILIDSPCRDEPRETQWENVPLQGLYWRFSGGAMHRLLEHPYSPVPNEVIGLDRLVEKASVGPTESVAEIMREFFHGNVQVVTPQERAEAKARMLVFNLITIENAPILAAVLAEVARPPIGRRQPPPANREEVLVRSAAAAINALLRLSKEGA